LFRDWPRAFFIHSKQEFENQEEAKRIYLNILKYFIIKTEFILLIIIYHQQNIKTSQKLLNKLSGKMLTDQHPIVFLSSTSISYLTQISGRA